VVTIFIYKEKNIMIKLKNLHKQNLTEALGGGMYDMSSIDRLKQRYPNGFPMDHIVTATGGDNFKNGISKINGNSTGIRNIINAILVAIGWTTMTSKPTNKIKITVNGGASAVGNSTGFNNQKLAETRRDNLIAYIKSTLEDYLDYINISVGDATVGVADIKDSKEAEVEQYVSVTFKKSINIPVTGEIGDNTNVSQSPIYRNNKKGDNDEYDTVEYIKRICVQIPETYVDKYKAVIKKFKQDHKLSNIPWAVYDTDKKIKSPDYKLTNDWGLDKKTKNSGLRL
jgi:hypothetical protein